MSSRVEKKQSARERAAEMRAQQAKAEQRRRMAFAGAAIAFVVIVVVALVVVRLNSSGTKAKAGTASGSLIKALADVPTSVSNEVGAGTAQNPPEAIKGTPASGKPKILYVGGEFCPYCAAERWAVAVALERFGDFTKLRTTSSSAQDVDPSTPTLSFHGSTYTSDLIDFTGKEVFGADQQTPLDTLSSADQKIESSFNSEKSIPFVYIDGKWASAGATYDPGLLAGMTQAEVAKELQNPDSDVTKAILGSANVFTAAICQSTGGKPTDVCSASGVTKAASKLGSS